MKLISHAIVNIRRLENDIYRLDFLDNVEQKRKFRKILLQSWMCISFKILKASEGILAEKRGNALRNVPIKVYSK